MTNWPRQRQKNQTFQSPLRDRERVVTYSWYETRLRQCNAVYILIVHDKTETRHTSRLCVRQRLDRESQCIFSQDQDEN